MNAFEMSRSPKSPKKSTKTCIMVFKVIQGHCSWCKSKARVRLPISDNYARSNLFRAYIAPFLRYSDILAKNRKFSYSISFSALAEGNPFRIYRKALRILSLPGSRWCRFGDSSLHRFGLIHPCDGQTDRQNCDG